MRSGQPPAPQSVAPLYRHKVCPHWGLAVLLWQREGKRSYQFSDGKVRAFKEGYYGLFEQAVAPGDGTACAVRRLARVAGHTTGVPTTTAVTLRSQIVWFRRLFTDGFAGAAWLATHRGLGAKRRLKRYRDPAIADAHGLTRLGAPADYLERVATVLEPTDLVSKKEVAKLRALGPSSELAEAIHGWLTAEGDERRRFGQMVRALGSAATWPMATALRALLEPDEHVCVRVSTMREQAKTFLPNFRGAKRPTYEAYANYLHVAKALHGELISAGETPRDLLDIHDFIWVTLRPAARKAMLVQQDETPDELTQSAA